MAKIDTSQIAGYDDMTAEEKLKALEGYEYDIPEADYTGYVKKSVFDKTASELASLKKAHKAQLSEDEQKAEEQQAKFDEMQAELESLKREKAVSGYAAKYLADGYDEKLANATAEALADGDLDKVFANQKKFLEGYKAKVEAEVLNGNPKPQGGSGGGQQMTKEKFLAMSYEDMVRFKAENPEWKSVLK